MKAGRRSALAVLAPALVLALGAAHAQATRASSSSRQGDALLAVNAVGGGYPELHIALDLPVTAGAPSQLTLYVPNGFAIYPDRPPDSSVGSVQVTAQDNSYGSYTNSQLVGDIVAQPLPTTLAACTPGPYIGVWQLELSLLGQPFDVPMFLEHTTSSDPPGASTKLVLCAPTLPSADPSTARAFPISTLDLFLDDLEAPAKHGSYLWRALVTPLAVDRKTPQPGHTYELRAAMPVPNRLTLAGHVLRGAHATVLSGRLTGNGNPRGGVTVAIVARVRRVTPTGIQIDDHVVGHTTTTATGAYRVRVPLKSPTTFSALAEQTVTRCRGAALAPAGCISTTTAPAESDPLALTP